jgi:hypothetical protein
MPKVFVIIDNDGRLLSIAPFNKIIFFKLKQKEFFFLFLAVRHFLDRHFVYSHLSTVILTEVILTLAVLALINLTTVQKCL